MQTIGFIGASGLMGHGIAKNLRAKGHPLALTVHRNRERVADLLAAGASEAATPAAGWALWGAKVVMSVKERDVTVMVDPCRPALGE